MKFLGADILRSSDSASAFAGGGDVTGPADTTDGSGWEFLSAWDDATNKTLVKTNIRVGSFGWSLGHLAADHGVEWRAVIGGTQHGGRAGVFEAKHSDGQTTASLSAGAGDGVGRIYLSNALGAASFNLSQEEEEVTFLSIDEAAPGFVGKDVAFRFAEITGPIFKRDGRVLIGTEDATGTALLRINGPVESMTGGFVFPDDTVQTTAYTGSGGGGARGVTTVGFGAFPGASDASIAITGQAGIVAGSRVRAWIEATATADHSADEHWLETIDVVAGNIAPGVGFTIYAKNTGTLSEPVGEQWAGTRLAGPGTGRNQIRPDNGGGKATRLYGEFTVGWEWY